MSALQYQGLSSFALPGRNAAQPGSIALLPLQQRKFEQLVSTFRTTLAEIARIEEEVKGRARTLADEPATRQLWEAALLVGREVELNLLRERGQIEQQELEAFAQCLGFDNSERLAYVCRLPSPLTGEVAR